MELCEAWRPALTLFLLFTLLCGLGYPLAVTGAAALLWPHAAAGSIVRSGERATGSELLGQPFTRPEYFRGRPSAMLPEPCNGAASSGSNLSAGNPALAAAVAARLADLRAADSTVALPVPADLVTASGSGLDPHLSLAAMLRQVPRVARARGLDETALRELVQQQAEQPPLRCLGEPYVNVLHVNLLLDAGIRKGATS